MARPTVAPQRSPAHGPGSEPGRAEMARAVTQALGLDPSPSLVAEERITSGVSRLRLASAGRLCSFIVKRMRAEYARRNELVIRRWLPGLGIEGCTPGLLGIAADSDGCHVWHVYEDLGPGGLDTGDPDPERVSAVVRQIARIHKRFAEHPVLAECRLHGEHLAFAFGAAGVRDAIRGLERLRPPHLTPTAGQAALRDRLLERLHRHALDEPADARAMAAHGGPETLLHGDLWTSNIFVEPAADGFRVRLIDWDRAGVGSASYDLSTFLLRFASERRPAIMASYREAVGDRGWRIPGRSELNHLFEIAECSRYANRVIWPVLALLREGAAWGFEELAEVDTWFEQLGPVLPEGST